MDYTKKKKSFKKKIRNKLSITRHRPGEKASVKILLLFFNIFLGMFLHRQVILALFCIDEDGINSGKNDAHYTIHKS